MPPRRSFRGPGDGTIPVKDGDVVKVEYTGTFEDGTVFDTSDKHGQPLEFRVGTQQIIAGFENAVMGMEPGEEKDVTIQPAEGYGERDDERIMSVPRDRLPEEITPGEILVMELPNQEKMHVKVMDIAEEEVVLDMNHPLAGHVLNFKIKLVEIGEA